MSKRCTDQVFLWIFLVVCFGLWIAAVSIPCSYKEYSLFMNSGMRKHVMVFACCAKIVGKECVDGQLLRSAIVGCVNGMNFLWTTFLYRTLKK